MGISVIGLSCGHTTLDGWWRQEPNSAGGVSVDCRVKNTGVKPIKYLTIFFVPYNSVFDAVQCTITGASEKGITKTGPIPAGQETGFYCDNVWYNYSIKSVQVSKAIIEYMDGTKETLKGTQISVSNRSSGGGGCYVATAVYGSYDCPQVWTLRRYRDYTLAETWYGRAFIHTYYAISPTLVKWFGHTEWFKKMWKGKLDRMVKNLQDRGYKSTAYVDRDWR